MNAISDDELTLYVYNDGLAPERRIELTQRLRGDLDLARRYQQLRAELAALPPPKEHQPSPLALARWKLRLDQRAAVPAATRAPHWRLALAGATLVLLGVAVGTRLVEQPTVAAPAPAPMVAAATADGAPALSRGLSSYLGDARLVLADLPADDPQRRRQLVDEVIEQNRMYARAAQAQGDERLARVLRTFEPVLLALAEPPSADGSDLGARSQIDFELGILQTKLARSPSKIVQSL
ncbi:MAG: hypothetical protein IPK27_02170 [Rhodanobacteraceae bacterium]|nr:hypothetical protein [Rhodanobacteraceae bacterium]